MASRSARAAGQTDAARGGAQSFVRNGSASASHQRRISAGLQQFGWAVGSNVQIEYRWSAGNEDDTRKYALELVALAPEVIFALGSQTVGPLQRATRTVPIAFARVGDPVGAGFVDSLARPGGNITGFTSYEYGLGAKWLEVLKQIAPNVTRVAVVRDPANPAGIGIWGAIQSVSPSFGVGYARSMCAMLARSSVR
jgi:putative ABC transport system substrate-binding protein